jgi:hypothetical protein
VSTARLSRRRERLEGAGGPEIDPGPLVGRWVIFADETTGLSEVEVAESGGRVSVRALGSGTGEAPSWGQVPARVFSDDVGGDKVWGFRASYDHGFERVELFGYLNRGLLCVEAGTTFTDSSGRSPYFTRTFLYRP